MGFYVSPSVNIIEQDFSGTVIGLSPATAAMAGVFNWGAVNKPFQLSSETELIENFGKPDNNTAYWIMSAISYLAYSNSLLVTRVKTTGMNTANALAASSYLIENQDDFDSTDATNLALGGTFAARYPGSLGNSISVFSADYNSWQQTLTGTIATTANSTAIVGTTTTFTKNVTVGDNLVFTVNSVQFSIAVASIADDTHLTLASALPSGVAYTASGITAVCKWKYQDSFPYQPNTTVSQAALNSTGRDELHVIVVDTGGLFTGTAGTVLEKYTGVSKALDAKTDTGINNYYVNIINAQSKYVYATDVFDDTNAGTDLLGATGNDPGVALSTTAFKTMNRSLSVSLSAGNADSGNYTNASFQNALDILANDEVYDFDKLFVGKANSTVAAYAISNVAEIRKDCVAFISPEDISDGSVITGDTSTQIDKINAFKNALSSSSYYFVDNGYKYMYDRYNNVWRWVPLCGDIAGLCSRTDFVADPWNSPAGYTRGIIKNVKKLAVNPNKTLRDTLYKNSVNFVINQKGSGFMLFGDKTGLTKPSAFDRINVRRLFIVLEKSIATAAKFMLFENNTVYTRTQFKAMVEPFLRDVQGRGGITDFLVISDETINTPAVIQSNTFKARILVKPAYSINFVELSFNAVGASVEFSEVAGTA